MSLMVCGTGNWNGPKPGDPNTNNLLLTATPAFGGIDLNWTFPTVNPQAVAYTIIYRSLLGTVNSAVQLTISGGNSYYDRIELSTEIRYYYWVQVVTVNGTVGDMIGPASAYARPLIGDVIKQLSGQIDAGVLAQSLKQSIDQITLNKLGITQEMLDRDASDQSLGVSINEIEAHSGETRALLQQEVLARVSANEAFVSTVNTLYATLNGSIAAVQTEQTALVTADKALASSVTTVQTQLGGQIASVQTGLTTTINLVGDKVKDIGALYTAKVEVNGLIGGFGVYNDGKSVEAGFDVDTFWIGRTAANKRKPFIVSGGMVYIDEAAINSLTISKLRSEDGSFAFANGKLQAQLMGPVSFSSLTGAKPASDADKTSNNTSADTAKVGGVLSSTVVAQAGAAASTSALVNTWIKPSTTLISGNKIYTGDAYVDTLQIKGNAVTVPSFAQAYDAFTSTTWYTVLYLWVAVDVDGWLFASSSGYIAYGAGFGDTSSRLLINSVAVSGGGGTEAWVNACHSGAVQVGAGLRKVELQFISPSGKGRIIDRSLFAMAVQR